MDNYSKETKDSPQARAHMIYRNNVVTCSGLVGLEIMNDINTFNALEKRNWFLANISNNGTESHQAIIDVLTYLTSFINK